MCLLPNRSQMRFHCLLQSNRSQMQSMLFRSVCLFDHNRSQMQFHCIPQSKSNATCIRLPFYSVQRVCSIPHCSGSLAMLHILPCLVSHGSFHHWKHMPTRIYCAVPAKFSIHQYPSTLSAYPRVTIFHLAKLYSRARHCRLESSRFILLFLSELLIK